MIIILSLYIFAEDLHHQKRREIAQVAQKVDHQLRNGSLCGRRTDNLPHLTDLNTPTPGRVHIIKRSREDIGITQNITKKIEDQKIIRETINSLIVTNPAVTNITVTITLKNTIIGGSRIKVFQDGDLMVPEVDTETRAQDLQVIVMEMDLHGNNEIHKTTENPMGTPKIE